MKKSRLILILISLILCVLPELSFAKDVIPALHQAERQASGIFMALGPIGLIASAFCFMHSKQLGFGVLTGSLIGIAIFASRNAIMSLFVSTFS